MKLEQISMYTSQYNSPVSIPQSSNYQPAHGYNLTATNFSPAHSPVCQMTFQPQNQQTSGKFQMTFQSQTQQMQAQQPNQFQSNSFMQYPINNSIVSKSCSKLSPSVQMQVMPPNQLYQPQAQQQFLNKRIKQENCHENQIMNNVQSSKIT